MTEKDFVFAWLLAAKSGSGIAVAWKDSTIAAQLQEAQNIYKLIKQECNDEADSRTTD